MCEFINIVISYLWTDNTSSNKIIILPIFLEFLNLSFTFCRWKNLTKIRVLIQMPVPDPFLIRHLLTTMQTPYHHLELFTSLSSSINVTFLSWVGGVWTSIVPSVESTFQTINLKPPTVKFWGKLLL